MRRGDSEADHDEGGDPACWAHLFDNDEDDDVTTTGGGLDGDQPDLVLDGADFSQLAERLGDGVVICDGDGTIVFWNAAADRIFGWTATEAVGQNLDLIIPERNRPAHWKGYEQVMATGVTRYGDDLLQVPALHRSGERLSISFTVCLLTDPAAESADGSQGDQPDAPMAVKAIAAIVRDETDRWNAERDLRRELSELQAQVSDS